MKDGSRILVSAVLATIGLCVAAVSQATVVYRWEVIHDPYAEAFADMYPGETIDYPFGPVLEIDDDVWRGRHLNVSDETVRSVYVEEAQVWVTAWFGANLHFRDATEVCPAAGPPVFADLVAACASLGLKPGDKVYAFTRFLGTGFEFSDLHFGRYLSGTRLAYNDKWGEFQLAIAGGSGNRWTSEYWAEDGPPDCFSMGLGYEHPCQGVIGRYVLDRSTVPPVPEPGTLALLGLGLAGWE